MTVLLILGAGGHARVLVAALAASGEVPHGCIAPEAPRGAWPKEIAYLGQDAHIASYAPEDVLLVNGVGSVGVTTLRQQLFERWCTRGYKFATVIHPRAFIADGVQFGQGAQVMAGAIVQTGAVIGDNVLVNTGAIVDHDCVVGTGSHIATGARLSGGVAVAECVHIGTGAAVIQGIRIGRNSIVGAGAIVIRHTPDNAKLVGNPARVLGNEG